MSLRLRLFLTFFCLASLVPLSGLVSIVENRRIERHAQALASRSLEELDAATAAEIALRQGREAALEMVTAGYLMATEEAGGSARWQAAEARFWSSLREAERQLERVLRVPRYRSESPSAEPPESGSAAVGRGSGEWIGPATQALRDLEQPGRELVRLSRENPGAAARYWREVLGARIEGEILPGLVRFRAAALEESAAEAREITTEARDSNRLVWWMSGLALGLSILLGALTGRSVTRPVVALRDAAVGLGRGDFTTRVELESGDELQELGEALNQMGSDLGRSTVSKSYLDEVIETMTGALIIIDPDRRIRRINRAGLALLGYEDPELDGESIDRICPEQDPANTGSLVRLSEDGRVRNLDRNFLHKDGSQIPVLFSGSTLRDSRGSIREFVCVAHDISQRKQTEQRLRSSLHEKELLLREVHHRVKNNLQIISSLLDLQSESIDDPRHHEFVKDSLHRIRSMALIHEQLYRTDDLGEIHLRPYIETLTGHLFRSFGVEPGRVVLRTRLDELSIDLDQAIACGLIINELVSNSLKHAFPDGASGEVHLELTDRGNSRYRLRVADDGTGFAMPDPRNSRSMGLQLVSTLVKQLRGTLETRSEGGTECCIDFPRSEAR